MMRIVLPCVIASMGVVEVFVLTYIGRARGSMSLVVAGICGGVVSICIAIGVYFFMGK